MSAQKRAEQRAIPVWTTHEVIRLTSEQADFTVIIERKPDPKKVIIAMSRENAPFNRLKVDTTKGAILTFDGGSHKDSTWTIYPAPSPLGSGANKEEEEEGRYVFFRSNARVNGGGAKKTTAAIDDSCYWWLAGKEGVLCTTQGSIDKPLDENNISHCVWKVEAVPSLFERLNSNLSIDDSMTHLSIGNSKEVSTTEITEQNRQLSEEEIATFIEEGYVVRPSLAPMSLVSCALSLINGRLGCGSNEKDEVTRLGGDIANAPDIVALAKSPAVARLIAQLLGGAEKVKTIDGCQVALRFPHSVDSLVAGGAACQSVVSGRSWHTDGLRQGKKHSFSLLVGIALSDARVTRSDILPNCDANQLGQLWVWPKSHTTCHQLMRWPDGQVKRDSKQAVEWDTAGRDGSRDGQAAGVGYRDEDGSLPDLGPGIPLHLKAGDVVLAHGLLAHCGGPNLGCDIRYMLYFRVRHIDWSKMILESAYETDMWCDLEGTWKQLGRLP